MGIILIILGGTNASVGLSFFFLLSTTHLSLNTASLVLSILSLTSNMILFMSASEKKGSGHVHTMSDERHPGAMISIFNVLPQLSCSQRTIILQVFLPKEHPEDRISSAKLDYSLESSFGIANTLGVGNKQINLS